jgi:hypothetical protein
MNDLIAGLTGCFDITNDKLVFSAKNLAITAGIILGAGVVTAGAELLLDAMHDGINKAAA